MHAGIRSTSERYASYWNAFLFNAAITLVDVKAERNCSLSHLPSLSVNAPFANRWGIAGTDAKFHLKISQQNNVHKSQKTKVKKKRNFSSFAVSQCGCNTRFPEKFTWKIRQKLRQTRKHSSWMCTYGAVTRMSSDQVAMRLNVDRMTDRRLWKRCLPLRSVIIKISTPAHPASGVGAHSGQSWIWIAINMCEQDWKILLQSVKLMLFSKIFVNLAHCFGPIVLFGSCS